MKLWTTTQRTIKTRHTIAITLVRAVEWLESKGHWVENRVEWSNLNSGVMFENCFRICSCLRQLADRLGL